ncbi:sensor histidine kinase [Amycolatopsis antarctica]|uniref:histidine kinase n=1 Tax=Amycolatopsis antarctica TaxID=1854586 RepID=A0A263CXK8_9PSEU|nr:histidine kinase [Amycolatopsis antarctica]OZM70157.1 sensor histidine kinase [Amycolatopsis antarctica]
MDGARRRDTREWVVDSAVFLVAVLYGLVTAGLRLDSVPPEPSWLFTVDQFTGALGCAAVWLRRRWPVPLVLVLVVLSTFSELVGGALLVTLFTVAVHRPVRTTMWVFGLGLLAAVVYVVLRPEPDVPTALLLAFGVAVEGAVVGWGLSIHHQRRLVAQAETEAALRAEQAQHEVREEIAREMHDVLGHRLSLLSVHAGALEYRPDAPAEDVERTAAVIRQSAHEALQDLREVIGVLRAPVGELPQPTLADVDALVAESAAGGMRVHLREVPAGPVPDLAGRTAYRVVQEGLTNVRKHAPGAEASVAVTGRPGEGLTVLVVNGPPAATPAPGRPGRGLTGLGERAALAGGRLEHGGVPGGGWRLTAWLPWPA